LPTVNFAGAQIVVESTSEDAVFEAAMEAGADDVVPVPAEDELGPTSYKVGATWSWVHDRRVEV
jgi:transcriptional/translational regulatory protein YebC/TACO1